MKQCVYVLWGWKLTWLTSASCCLSLCNASITSWALWWHFWCSLFLFLLHAHCYSPNMYICVNLCDCIRIKQNNSSIKSSPSLSPFFCVFIHLFCLLLWETRLSCFSVFLPLCVLPTICCSLNCVTWTLFSPFRICSICYFSSMPVFLCRLLQGIHSLPFAHSLCKT